MNIYILILQWLKIWGKNLTPRFPQIENGYPPNLKNQKSKILESKMNFPQNKIWGIRLKRRCLRTFKNHCKASKIHSSGDMRPGRKKGKVRKTDERVEICRNKANRDKNENPCK